MHGLELRPAAPATNAEIRTIKFVAAVFLGIVAVSTVLHHGFPWVFDVPPNHGVPRSSMGAMFGEDLFFGLVALFCGIHAWKFHGAYRTSMFFFGSFVFTGAEESMWIFVGRYTHLLNSYYFTRGFLWFAETPASACFGWFFLAYGCMFVADVLLPNASVYKRAALAAAIGVNIDLWLDPVMVSPENMTWVWLHPDRIYILSIPLVNFVGWFILIFVFAVVYDRLPRMLQAHGPARATARFFGILMGFELAILVFFVTYLTAVRHLVPTAINLTFWGI